jgi:flavin-dependent dehydrogenase
MTEMAIPSIEPTLNAEAAASREWDVVVIGAGPAGALAATLLARHGLSTLLIERKSFPRHKICGACLNSQSLAVLRSVGLEHTAASAVALSGFHLQSRGKTLFLDLPGSVSISRERFDAELVGAAIDAGASFLCECSARVLPSTSDENLKLFPAPYREVEIKPDGRVPRVVHAAVVVAADGLSHSCVAGLDGFLPTVEAASRIGAGAVASEAPSFYQPGRIYMSVGQGGYVGLVRLEDQRLNIAAALDAKHVRDCGGLGEAARRIVVSAGFPEFEALSESSASDWHGTPALTRSTYPLAAERLFVIGDAAGYVEPFTGEGIAWALASAQSVVPLVQCACQRWDGLLERTWQSDWMQAVGRHQLWCRRLARLLRHPAAVAMVTRIVSTCPWLAGPVIRRLNHVPKSAVAPLPSSTTARQAG